MSLTSTIEQEQPRITIEAAQGHGFAQKLDERYTRTFKLTTEQCGHLRHFHNLASQIDGEWSLVGSQEPGHDPITIPRARLVASTGPPSKQPYLFPTLGHVAQWMSEIAGPEDLNALLRHADGFMQPTWREGGLYYARCDRGWDDEGNYTYVEPYTGNAAIGYARLNVQGGQKRMWDEPWTGEEIGKRPWVDGVGLEMGVDVLRGRWDEVKRVLLTTFRTWDARVVRLRLVVRNLAPGLYGVYVDGTLRDLRDVAVRGDEVVAELEVGGKEIDLVVLQAPGSGAAKL